MSTTIDSLDIQITTSAGQSAANIERLANALEKLRANSKLTTVTNNLGKLKTALDGLRGTSGAINNLGKLSQAMQGLSNIPKLTNLTSAMNALKNIPNIVNGLSNTALDAFQKKMLKLASALGPLATQINAIGRGFSRLPSQINGAVTATNRMAAASHNAKKSFDMSSMGLMALIANYSTLIGIVNQAVQAMAKMLDQAIGWDGIQFRFGRAFGEDAEETYKYIQKLNEALRINIQEFMQYSSMYGSLLSGFGLPQEKITTISVGLSELTYDLWAANNDVVKRYEDVATAVKSAITGEIEPIRNLGIAMTEASLQEFIDTTNLAGMSIEKMTEAQKSEVRYAAMVNAAMNQGIVGTYAREMNTAEGAIRSLSQSFKGLIQALGSLFIPLLQVIVPYLTAFVELLTDAVFWVAKLFGIPIQRISWGETNKGVGGIADGAKEAASGLDSASKAAKKLKQYTMGFDELNVINPDSGASGGAGGAGGAGAQGWGEGLDLDTLWDDSVFDQASKKVDELKAKITEFFGDWGWLIGLVGAGLTGLMIHKAWPTILSWGTKIALMFGGMVDLVKAVWGAFKGSDAAESALAFMSPLLSNIVNWLKTTWVAVKALGILNIAGWATTIAVVIAAVASVVYFLYENWDKVTEAVKNFFKENISPKLKEIGEHFSDIKEALGPVGDLFKKVYDKAKEFIEGIDWKSIGTVFEIVGGVIFSVIGGVIATAFNILVGMVENVIQVFNGMVQLISGAVKFIVALFKGDFMGVIDATLLIAEGIQNLWNGMVGFVVDIVSDFVEGIISWFTNLWDELVGHSIVPDTINGIIDWFLSLPGEILKPVEQFTEDVLKIFKDLWENTKVWWAENVAPKFTSEYWLNKFNVIKTAVRTKLDEFKASVIEKWNGIKSWFSSNIAPKFTKEYWINKFSGLKDGFVQTVKNMINSGVDKLNSFIGWLNSHLKFSWDGLTIAGKEIYPGGSVQIVTIPSIPRFENGGFIEDGLFTMNRGEIAGKFNNGKSVVANNEQIIAGISEGVYSAVVAAMSETQRGGEQPVVVYLDGKQIYSSVKRAESRRGVDLMGNQVGYVY